MKRWLAGCAALVLGALAAQAGGPTVTPSEGGIGQSVVLGGFDFAPVKKPKVLLLPHSGQSATKDVAVKVVSFTTTTIDVQPISGAAGVYDVEIVPKDKGVAKVTLPNTFTIDLPAPSSIDPPSGAVKTAFTIHGTGFGPTKGKVTIGGAKAKVSGWTDQTISIVAPPKLATGAQPVVVTNKAGSSTAALSLDVTGPPPGGGADQYVVADLSGKGHFEATDKNPKGITVDYKSAQKQITFGGSAKPALGLPDLVLSIIPVNFARVPPYDISVAPIGLITTIVGATYTQTGLKLYIASLGAAGSNLTVTITKSDGTYFEGKFSGTLVDGTGAPATPIVVTNGAFRVKTGQ